MKAKLTSRSVTGLKPKATPFEVHDREILGLSIRVMPSGSKTWYLRYRIEGARRLKFGRAESMTVAQAKSKARETLADVIDGGDPAEAKRGAVSTLWARFLTNTRYGFEPIGEAPIQR